MKEDELLVQIENELRGSDIVWPKYGSDTVKELARRLASLLNRTSNDEDEWVSIVD